MNLFANQKYFNLFRVWFTCTAWRKVPCLIEVTCVTCVSLMVAMIAQWIKLLPPGLVTGDINGEEGGEQAGGPVFCGKQATCCPKPKDWPQTVLQRCEEEKHLIWPPCAEGTGCYLVGLVGWYSSWKNQNTTTDILNQKVTGYMIQTIYGRKSHCE